MSRLRTPVLMLHHVEPAPLDPPPHHRDSYLSPEELAGLLDLLAAGGYRTATLAAVAEAWRRGRRPPRRTVVLTFDDGCRCFLEHALPALRSRGMTATLFAVSGLLGSTNRWDSEPSEEGRPLERREELLDATALRRVAAAGIEIGSHGRTHRRLTEGSAEEIAAEVTGSKRELEAALGLPVRTFCYPYGHAGPLAREAVRDAGYLAAVAIEGHPGAAVDDPFAIARQILRPGESRLELRLKVSGLYRLWQRLPRLGLLAALRRRSS